MTSFPILMYHAVLSGGRTSAAWTREREQDVFLRDRAAWRYTLDDQAFERQMAFLAHFGISTVDDWADLRNRLISPRVCLTFDDGHRSNFEQALPILMKYRLRAVFFITTDWIGRPGAMDEAQLRELRRAGMPIGTHGRSHRFFSELAPGEILRELADSKGRLEEILGEPVPAVSLPGGRTHAEIRALARQAGYQHLFTSTVALADPAGDPLDWPRLPITRDMSDAFVQRLTTGDAAAVGRLARAYALRRWGRRLLGPLMRWRRPSNAESGMHKVE